MNKLKVLLLWAVFSLWVLVLIAASLVPDSLLVGDFLGNQSGSRLVEHAVAYFIGALMCFYSFRLIGIRFVLLAGMGVFLFGVIFEVVQIWIPYRTFNPKDMVANGVGAGLFMIIWSSFFIYQKYKASTFDKTAN